MNLDLSILMPVVIAFGISVVLCPIVIPFLRKLKFGQFVRDDGPQSHLKKSGNSDDGRSDHPGVDPSYVSALHKKIFGTDSGFVYDIGIWNHWIFWMIILKLS